MNQNVQTVSPPATAPVVAPRPSTGGRASNRAAFGRGVARGLLPLLTLVLTAGVTAGLTVLAWQLTPGLDFFARRTISMAIVTVGLVAAVILYAAMCIRALRRAARWQEGGEIASAIGALAALGLTAVLVTLPLMLAVLVPQHPAP
jgi:hypothetical protein